MRKEGLFLICVVVLAISQITIISGAKGSFGTFEQSREVRIIQVCATCTFNNITSISLPNSTVIVVNVPMTRDLSEYTYNLTADLTNIVGTYTINGIGDLNGDDTIWVVTLDITKTGTQLKTSESIIYLFLTLAIFAIFLLSMWFTIAIPYSNDVNHQNMVVKVTRKKYIKIGFVLLSYMMFIWFLNSLIAVSDNFLVLSLYTGFMGFMFELFTRFSIPFSLFLLALSLLELVRDANIMRALKSGGPRG